MDNILDNIEIIYKRKNDISKTKSINDNNIFDIIIHLVTFNNFVTNKEHQLYDKKVTFDELLPLITDYLDYNNIPAKQFFVTTVYEKIIKNYIKDNERDKINTLIKPNFKMDFNREIPKFTDEEKKEFNDLYIKAIKMLNFIKEHNKEGEFKTYDGFIKHLDTL